MRYKWLVALTLVAAWAPALGAQSVKDGVEAWQKGDYAGAVTIWRTHADKGDSDAAFNLGQAYRVGRGVAQDLAEAQGWFERAARKGHIDAQATLGIMLLQAGNQAGGLRWLKLAALKGEPKAMLVYGTAMFNGDGIPRDPLLGYLYVTRAAETGLEPARRTLQRLDEILPAEQREKALQLALPTAEVTPAPTEKPMNKTAPKKAVTAAAPVESRPKPTPKPARAASGDWRVQLGAFSKRSSAESLFDKLSGKPVLTGRSAFYVSAGPVTRLQVGPFESQAAAQGACNALKPQACFPVRAK